MLCDENSSSDLPLPPITTLWVKLLHEDSGSCGSRKVQMFSVVYR